MTWKQRKLKWRKKKFINSQHYNLNGSLIVKTLTKGMMKLIQKKYVWLLDRQNRRKVECRYYSVIWISFVHSVQLFNLVFQTLFQYTSLPCKPCSFGHAPISWLCFLFLSIYNFTLSLWLTFHKLKPEKDMAKETISFENITHVGHLKDNVNDYEFRIQKTDVSKGLFVVQS